jgi:excisionase family DNA binding protein
MSAAATKIRSHHAKAATPWMTVQEAADYLGVGVDTIYEACAKRGLKHAKLGHSTIRLKREWLDAWAEAHCRQAS